MRTCLLGCQDFEALTPNTLARTIETVEGGGMVVILLKTMTSFQQLYTMSMVLVNISLLFHASMRCLQMQILLTVFIK